MATWSELTEIAPELTARVQAAFDAHLHKLIATLRADGSPRISGTEATFRAGDLWLGMMPHSRKAADLLRDPRFALHSAPLDLELKEVGDAKLSGVVIMETDPEAIRAFFADFVEERGTEAPGEALLCRCDIHEMSITTVAGDELVIDLWHAGSPPRQVRTR
jgi:hypothetical protein